MRLRVGGEGGNHTGHSDRLPDPIVTQQVAALAAGATAVVRKRRKAVPADPQP